MVPETQESTEESAETVTRGSATYALAQPLTATADNVTPSFPSKVRTVGVCKTNPCILKACPVGSRKEY